MKLNQCKDYLKIVNKIYFVSRGLAILLLKVCIVLFKASDIAYDWKPLKSDLLIPLIFFIPLNEIFKFQSNLSKNEFKKVNYLTREY